MKQSRVPALKYTWGQPEKTSELLTEEAPLQIKINGKAYTITMRSPGNDKFLAAGLLLTEGILNSPKDIIRITEKAVTSGEQTLIIDLEVKEELLLGKNLFNRSIASSASCGVCGKIDLCDLVHTEAALLNSKKIDINILPRLFEGMKLHQENFGQTGGSHAAAVFSVEGDLLSVHEDIGRHNAVDKSIGELFLNDKLKEGSVLCVSGRVSYEIVAKCSKAGLPFLAAVSAPSSMAVDLCRQKGITLIAFCRGERATVYTHEANILQYSCAESV